MRELEGGSFLASTESPSWDWLMAYIPPEDQAEVTATIERAIAARAVFELEHRVRRADGTTGWTRSRAVPVLEPDGRVREWFGAATDVTARREAEAELRRANEDLEARVAERTAERNLLATIVETTDVMMMALGLDYTILSTNKANADEFERIYGVRPKTGDDVLALLEGRPEEQAQVRAGWGRGLGGEEFTFVEDFGDPAHDRPYYEIKFRTLRDATGQRIGAYNFVTDVTERLRRDAQLAAAQEQLRRQSQKMEAMGSLTGGVAHDFNNLLTPIIGSLDRLVTRGVGSERERRLMAGALESAERAKTLVQRLLAFARRQPLQPVAVDLGALVEGMRGLVGSTLGPKVDLRVDVARGLPPAHADPNQLEMALLNLAVNARDAMPEGGALTVAVTAESVRGRHAAGLKRGPYVRLAVMDTGTGMDAATLARAVEPFFSTKGVGRGTGLGLSMAHGLAAQLGGGLAIDSAPGRGTTVALWLPVSGAPVSEAEAGRAAPGPSAPRGRALLVDDEDLVRMSTADMLEDLSYEVLEAGSAEGALGLLREGAPIDLLVTDHLMPGLSGADLVRAAWALRPDLPALIVSGYADVEDLAPDLPRLPKPFRVAELAERLVALAPDTRPAI
jgi:signal transduction histidine kinase/CheY-like chemotaxis protein